MKTAACKSVGRGFQPAPAPAPRPPEALTDRFSLRTLGAIGLRGGRSVSKSPESCGAVAWLEFEAAVTVAAAVKIALASSYSVDVGGGGRDVAEAVDELVAPLEELGGLVAGVAGAAGGSEVMFGALDGGGGVLLVGVGGADVLG